jgi:flagellar protein FliO/FliZ
MPQPLSRIALAAIPVLHLAVAAAQGAPAKAFAAPTTAASLPSGTAGGIGQATLALLLVLAVIFGIAWVARRMRGMTRAGGQGIEVVAQAAVGPRERVVVIRVGATRLVLGVAPGRVTALHELAVDATIDAPRGAPGAGEAKFPTFGENLKSLMNRARGK